MTIARLQGIAGFDIDSTLNALPVFDANVLRLDLLETDLGPPPAAIEATRAAIGSDQANRASPFPGLRSLREAIAARVSSRAGVAYDPDQQVVVTAGGLASLTAALMATVNPGDHVLLTDPTASGVTRGVRLAGAIPRYVPFRVEAHEWWLDLDQLEDAADASIRAIVIVNPDMPSGAVLSQEAWESVARICLACDCWLIYVAAFEAILFDGHLLIHPSTLPGMAERTITVGSVAKELRMGGWRIGWLAGPSAFIHDVASIASLVSPSGIAQPGADAALRTPDDGMTSSIAEWQRRRDVVLEQLQGWPVVAPTGGWSLLLDTAAVGLDPRLAAQLLLTESQVAATPLTGWAGPVADRHLRLVFSNEPLERLATLRARLAGTTLDRLRRAWT